MNTNEGNLAVAIFRWTESLGRPHIHLVAQSVCGSITIWLVTLIHTPHCRIYKCMHPEKGNCNVCRNVHKSPNPLCSQTPKANQTHWKVQAKYKNQNYRKQLLKGITGWNMHLKVHYRDSKDSTHKSVRLCKCADYKNSIIYRNVSQKRGLKIWQKNKHCSFNKSDNYKSGMSRV
jgi:hypothetical protein